MVLFIGAAIVAIGIAAGMFGVTAGGTRCGSGFHPQLNEIPGSSFDADRRQKQSACADATRPWAFIGYAGMGLGVAVLLGGYFMPGRTRP